ncbi:MAG: O-antigen ligase family protein [bacterium]
MPTTWRPHLDRPFRLDDLLLFAVFLTLPLEGMGLLKRAHAGAGFAGGLTFAKIFILLALAAWAVRTIVSQDQYLLRALFGIKTTLFLMGSLLVAFSTLVQTKIRPYFSQFFVQAVSLFLLYLLIVGVVQARTRVFQWALAALLIGTIPSSLGGVYEALTGHLIMKGRVQTPLGPEALTQQRGLYKSESGRYRIASFSGDCGIHGVHWAVYGPMSMAVPFLFRRRWLKVAGWGFVMLTVVNCLGTGTRTGMGSLLFGVLAFFALAKIPHKPQIAAAAIVAALVLGIMMGAPLERILGKEHKAETSTAWRFAMTKIAIQMIEDHPILGVGVGNYVGLYYKYCEKVPEANRTPVIMHNGYLAVWSEQGTLGLICFLGFFGSVALDLFRTVRRPASRYIHFAAAGLLGGLVAHLITQLGYPLLGDELGYWLMGFGVTITELNRRLHGEYPFRGMAQESTWSSEPGALPAAVPA